MQQPHLERQLRCTSCGCKGENRLSAGLQLCKTTRQPEPSQLSMAASFFAHLGSMRIQLVPNHSSAAALPRQLIAPSAAALPRQLIPPSHPGPVTQGSSMSPQCSPTTCCHLMLKSEAEETTLSQIQHMCSPSFGLNATCSVLGQGVITAPGSC